MTPGYETKAREFLVGAGEHCGAPYHCDDHSGECGCDRRVAALAALLAEVAGAARADDAARRIYGTVWVIKYDDADMPDEVFSGDSARESARRRFDDATVSWNCHLFERIAGPLHVAVAYRATRRRAAVAAAPPAAAHMGDE